MAFNPNVQGTGYRAQISENLLDVVSGDLLTRAVTIVPCGHVLNEDTVIRILARDRLCPLDRTPIREHVPNYNVRHLATIEEAHPEEKAPSAESQSLFAQAKQHVDAGKYAQAIPLLLNALEQSPTHEKAQTYLQFCLDREASSHQAPVGAEGAAAGPAAAEVRERFHRLRLAADQGDAYAQCNLGMCYANGTGVAKDESEAVRYFRLGAQQGNATAQCNLGACYDNGTGIAKDEREAVRYYRLAA